MTKGSQVYDEQTGQSVTDYIISEISDSLEFFDNEFYAFVVYEVIKNKEKGERIDHLFFSSTVTAG
ncbi:MAG: hypothetical protein IPH57_05820 [Saprospiraceae bacterium]|nr:hypothetical protein [Saprospiraceae bacterium]